MTHTEAERDSDKPARGRVCTFFLELWRRDFEVSLKHKSGGKLSWLGSFTTTTVSWRGLNAATAGWYFPLSHVLKREIRVFITTRFFSLRISVFFFFCFQRVCGNRMSLKKNVVKKRDGGIEWYITAKGASSHRIKSIHSTHKQHSHEKNFICVMRVRSATFLSSPSWAKAVQTVVCNHVIHTTKPKQRQSCT